MTAHFKVLSGELECVNCAVISSRRGESPNLPLSIYHHCNRSLLRSPESVRSEVELHRALLQCSWTPKSRLCSARKIRWRSECPLGVEAWYLTGFSSTDLQLAVASAARDYLSFCPNSRLGSLLTISVAGLFRTKKNMTTCSGRFVSQRLGAPTPHECWDVGQSILSWHIPDRLR